MINDFKKLLISRKNPTGGKITDKDYEFNHVILTLNEYEETFKEFFEDIPDELENFLFDNDINFISVRKYGIFKFIHFTEKCNVENILKNGFKNNYQYDRINDLGQGLYVIDSNNWDSIDNLNQYIEDFFGISSDSEPEDYHQEIALILGDYKGVYEECIYGDDHIGYIVLKDDLEMNISNLQIINTTIGEFREVC